MASSSSTTEDERLQFALLYAKRMLWTCSKHHKTCKSKDLNANKLPTRVIDVGDFDGSREPFLFIPDTLSNSAQEPKGSQPSLLANDRNPFARAIDATEKMRYVALSYCWGQTQNFITTIANLASMKEKIPLDKLPQTIRDAIIITRALGIQYLWVDALCIIQDSKDDWEAESGRMMGVYGRAFLTISAALGPDVHYGLFRKWNPHAAPSTTDWLPLQNDPLYSRAWALQERMLSIRLLIFGSDRLYWECDNSQPQDGHGKNVPGFYVLDFHQNHTLVTGIWSLWTIPATI